MSAFAMLSACDRLRAFVHLQRAGHMRHRRQLRLHQPFYGQQLFELCQRILRPFVSRYEMLCICAADFCLLQRVRAALALLALAWARALMASAVCISVSAIFHPFGQGLAHAPAKTGSEGQLVFVSASLECVSSYEFHAGPSILSITPSNGPTQGGTAVSIAGNFFGSTAGILFSTTNDTSMTVTRWPVTQWTDSGIEATSAPGRLLHISNFNLCCRPSKRVSHCPIFFWPNQQHQCVLSIRW